MSGRACRRWGQQQSKAFQSEGLSHRGSFAIDEQCRIEGDVPMPSVCLKTRPATLSEQGKRRVRFAAVSNTARPVLIDASCWHATRAVRKRLGAQPGIEADRRYQGRRCVEVGEHAPRFVEMPGDNSISPDISPRPSLKQTFGQS